MAAMALEVEDKKAIANEEKFTNVVDLEKKADDKKEAAPKVNYFALVCLLLFYNKIVVIFLVPVCNGRRCHSYHIWLVSCNCGWRVTTGTYDYFWRSCR